MEITKQNYQTLFGLLNNFLIDFILWQFLVFSGMKNNVFVGEVIYCLVKVMGVELEDQGGEMATLRKVYCYYRVVL